MPYRVAIRKNETGEVRLRNYDYDWFKYESSDLFWWTEGNMSCDCNRYLEFERAAGVEPDSCYAPCGETAYSVLYVELPDGTKIDVDDAA